jgi:hypothetical protein
MWCHSKPLLQWIHRLHSHSCSSCKWQTMSQPSSPTQEQKNSCKVSRSMSKSPDWLHHQLECGGGNRENLYTEAVNCGCIPKCCCSLFWHQILVVWILLPTLKVGVKFRIHSMSSSHIQNDVHNSDVKNVWNLCTSFKMELVILPIIC